MKANKHSGADAPDGGYGWVIVSASFVIYVLTNGSFYGSGVFLVEFVNYFQESTSEASFIGSVTCSMTVTSGLLTVYLTRRFGARILVMSGAFLSTFGIIISIFAPNVSFLVFSYGVCVGIGSGLASVSSLIAVSQYFKKRYAFANGIMFSGASIGTLCLPQLYHFIIEVYGWRGALFIVAGLNAHIFVCGCLLKPLKRNDFIKNEFIDRIPVADTTSLNISSASYAIHTPSVNEKGQGSCPLAELESLTSVHGDVEGSSVAMDHKWSGDGTKTDSSELAHWIVILEYEHGRDPMTSEVKYKIENVISESKIDTLRLEKHNGTMTANFNNTSYCEDGHPKTKMCAGINRSILPSSIGLEIFIENPTFSILCVAQFLEGMGFLTAVMYLVARTISVGISELDAVFLLTVMGAGSLIGRISHGCFVDCGYISAINLMGTTIGGSGVVLLCIPFTHTYTIMAGMIGVYGLCRGTYNSVNPVALRACVGDKDQPIAVGWNYLFMGIGYLSGPPFAGWLYDTSGSYNSAFYGAGGVLVCSGILVVLATRVGSSLLKRAGKTTVKQNGHVYHSYV